VLKALEDLWILTETGITLYTKAKEGKINEQLFGALMSAINSFAEGMGGLSSLEISKKRVSIIKKKEFLFIASSLLKTKEKRVLKELEEVSKKFFEKYSEKLKNWDMDISIFSDFEI